jgi:hypothetical protein
MRAAALEASVPAAMQGILALMLIAALACGCSISADGLGFAARPPDSNQVAKTRDQLQRNASSVAGGSPAGTEAQAPAVQPGLLIIGTTGPFRALSDVQRDDFYRAYVRFAEQWHPGEPPSLSSAAFKQRLAGWTSVQTAVGFFHWRIRVLVPASAAQDTRFASPVGSFVWGDSKDLVVARSDRDGLVWLERVLCRDDKSYRACAEKYQTGLFDENTGQELARDDAPKVNGELVDVTSYVRLSKDPDRHRASELDPRALNRCDDCKGSVPGSVQSAVQVP